MSAINGVGNNHYPITPLNGQSKVNGSTVAGASQSVSRSSDKVELSGVQGYLAKLSSGSDVRADKVASIRASLEAGTYNEDQKIDFALDSILDDVNAA